MLKKFSIGLFFFVFNLGIANSTTFGSYYIPGLVINSETGLFVELEVAKHQSVHQPLSFVGIAS